MNAKHETRKLFLLYIYWNISMDTDPDLMRTFFRQTLFFFFFNKNTLFNEGLIKFSIQVFHFLVFLSKVFHQKYIFLKIYIIIITIVF